MLNLSKTEILKGYIIDKKPRRKVKIQQRNNTATQQVEESTSMSRKSKKRWI